MYSMILSEDGDGEERFTTLSPRPPKKLKFLGTFIGRRKSTGQELLYSRHLPNGSPTVANPDPDPDIDPFSHVGRATRSHSNASIHAFKAQWADALISQEPMQTSLTQLRQTVEVYERQASVEKWGELWQIQADVKELNMLAREALDKHKSGKRPFKGLERFSTVALEYSKLLDVVMNQCPEYVTLAWGVTKLLLVANINHSKLKQNVESHLISIGQQLGLVNQLIAYSPTETLVEAVAALYANFSEFLGKALRCYAKSKLAGALEAFGFPWEAKFQKVVSQVDAQIRRIQDLASASHFHATLRNQHLLQSLCEHQHEEKKLTQQEPGPEQFRKEIKEEMKREIHGLLQDFDIKWVQRFDELLLQQTTLHDGRDRTSRPVSFTSDAQTILPLSMPQVYLADFVSNPQTLLDFRDKAFPQLQQFDQREIHIRAGSRLLTAYDWQHCVALLRHPSMRSWLSTEKSGILWIDTYQVHKLDWASVFSTRLIDEWARLDYSMVITHFCQGGSPGNAVSTTAILIQSLISTSISLGHEQFTVREVGFTQQRFQDAQNDFKRLWTLFLDVLRLAAKGKCVWIVIDHVDILQKETNLEGPGNVLKLLRNFDALTDDPVLTVKILITSRVRDAARLSTKIAEARILASRHPIITVPRGHHRNEATLLAKLSKKLSRLTEPQVNPEIPTSHLSVDSLLFNTDSESDYLEEISPKSKHAPLPQQQLAAPTAREKLEMAQRDIGSDAGESDSASLFDPLASSDDSEPTFDRKEADLHSCTSEDSADEDFSQTKPLDCSAKDTNWESTGDSTDDEDHMRMQPTAPLNPKIVVALPEHSTRSAASSAGSVKDGLDANAKEMNTPPALSTSKAAYFACNPHSNNLISIDSDSDDPFH